MAANISSSQNHENPKPKCEQEPQKAVPKCVLLLSAAFNQTPTTPLLNGRNFKPNLLIPHLHSSIVSAANEFFRLINSFASQNPFLSNLSSLAAQFQQTCHQIRCRNQRNVIPFPSQNFAAILPGDSVAGIVVTNGIMNFLNLYNTLLVVRLVLTWFPNAPPAVVSPLSTLCDPYLNIFRGLIPPLGGTLDLSPILAFLVLNAFTSTAAALPCELPSPTPPQAQGIQSSQQGLTNLTSSQKLWMRRLCRSQPKRSSDVK